MVPAEIANDPNVQAARMAASFAQEIGLPVGNLWEPPIARKIAADLATIEDADLADSRYAVVEAKYRFLLGLDRVEPGQLRLVSRLRHYE